MGIFLNKLKSAVGVFKIERDGYYFPAKIIDKKIQITGIVVTKPLVSVTLPLFHDGLEVIYKFGTEYAPSDIASVEMQDFIGTSNCKYFSRVPYVKINNYNDTNDSMFAAFDPERCLLEIYNSNSYSMCSDGRSIINKQGALMYYAYFRDREIELPEGVRSIGRDCLPRGRRINLPSSFNFGLDEDYDSRDLENEFCNLVEKYKVKYIRTKSENPVWQYDDVFFNDKKHDTIKGILFDSLDIKPFKIERLGYYFEAEIKDNKISIIRLVTTDPLVQVSLPLEYRGLDLSYNFGNERAPSQIRSVKIPYSIGLNNLKYFAYVPYVKILNYQSSDIDIFNIFEPRCCYLEIYDSPFYSTCSDGRSIIDKQGALMYYAYLSDKVIEVPEGVRSVGRNCFPQDCSLSLPASFDFGLGKKYDNEVLKNRFYDLVDKFQVQQIKTKKENPVWEFNDVFLHDKINNITSGCILKNKFIFCFTEEQRTSTFRNHNLDNINIIELSADYRINLTDIDEIKSSIKSLISIINCFPNLVDVLIDKDNPDWMSLNGCIIYKKTIIYILPKKNKVYCPDGCHVYDTKILKPFKSIRLSDTECLGVSLSSSDFIKDFYNKLKDFPNLETIEISENHKLIGITENFIINKKTNQCIFHRFCNVGKEIVIPTTELISWQDFRSDFKIKCWYNKNIIGYRKGRELDDSSDEYPQVEKLIFPSNFNFSKLLYQEELNNKDLERIMRSNEANLYSYLHTYWTKLSLPIDAIVDTQQEYMDSVLILLIKQFCNLKTIEFGENDYYENRKGYIINKKTKKLLLILPEAGDKIVIPNDLWIDELSIFNLSCSKAFSIYLPYEKYKDENWLEFYLTEIHKYYVPVRWALHSLEVRNRDCFVVYDRFGIVPKEEAKSSIYRVKKRAAEPQKQLPFEGMDNDFYKRDSSIKNEEKEIKDGDTICCKLNSVVTVVNTFSCINEGHEMIRVYLEVLIKDISENKPFKKKVEAYYCKQCKRIFMYNSEFESLRKYTNRYRYYMFNRFSINGSDVGYSSSPETWASESILKEAGYEVNKNSMLSQSERLAILVELNKRGVPYHTIVSYINVFVNVIGASITKDMTNPVMRWKSDLKAVKDLYFKGILN